MKTTILLILAAIGCLLMASCAATAEGTAAVVASIGAAGEFITALQPVLSPEMQAKLATLATQFDGEAQATVQAVGVLADAVSTLRLSVDANLDSVATTVADMPSREEVLWTATGTGTGATGVSRLLSHWKHAPKTPAT